MPALEMTPESSTTGRFRNRPLVDEGRVAAILAELFSQIAPAGIHVTAADGMLLQTCDFTAGTAGSFSTSTAEFIRWPHPAGAELDLKCFKFPILTVWTRTG
jgi:hypothetical protein